VLRKREEDHAKAAERARRSGTPFTEELVLIPESMSHGIMVLKCVHSCIQPKRGSGQKQQLRSRYFECLARITAEATYNAETGQWFVKTKNEVRRGGLFSHPHTKSIIFAHRTERITTIAISTLSLRT
jgi:hypothetical protein